MSPNERDYEPLHLVQQQPRSGLGIGVLLSLVLHAALVTTVWFRYRPQPQVVEPPPRYVEIMQNVPQQQFAEAPGAKLPDAKVNANAPFSDANRKSSSPRATGERPTSRPGEGGLFVPGGASRASSQQQRQMQQAERSAASPQTSAVAEANRPQNVPPDKLVFQERRAEKTAMSGPVDWRSAIREVGKVASIDPNAAKGALGNAGGESGFTAENGPVSFETQWYPWGDYAEAMVSKIRVNWYANMPAIIRTGLKGVVTIRFTIERSGRISDVVILKSSEVPPFDFAAKKAIELSSPFAPLPKDFPNPSERVTCQFFYNIDPYARTRS